MALWIVSQRAAYASGSEKFSSLGSTPHPAVARIIVPEGNSVSYGSGTLIDVRDQYGLVVTNWHVVRDAADLVEVVFPCGFRSHARPLKLDADWDLAALVIWRPPIQPVPIAQRAPQAGDELTICGYGQGTYRQATGRCTQYLAPRIDFPREMVELNVQARQGDSGGPIFNAQGELAGVLFGVSQGTTLGSFGGRVESFLTSLAPDIGDPQKRLATAPRVDLQEIPKTPLSDQPAASLWVSNTSTDMDPIGNRSADQETWEQHPGDAMDSGETPDQMGALENSFEDHGQSEWIDEKEPTKPSMYQDSEPRVAAHAESNPPTASIRAEMPPMQIIRWRDVAGETWLEQTKTLLAAIGLLFIMLRLVRFIV
ncbi:MAG: trypsin-like peptidase domain-containing protein [Pirellulales bacterium]|nr:trypsin-like peptidase domain-containing protein [Pirellulales bacterium]